MQLRILLSYWYYKDIDLDALFAKYFTRPYPDVFADSGAFSAMTQGVAITPQEYAAWIKRWRHLFFVYSNLDVIKDAKATWKNQQILEDMGLTPLPAFHVMEDWKWLEQYIDRYPYIALGVAGLQKRKRELMAWLVKAFKLAQGKSVYHGFALTSWKIMSSFPWYSVDSSSWGQGFRFGQVPLFDTKRGRFYKASLGDHKSCYQHASLFRDLGFDPIDFSDRARNDRAKICAISALSYMKAEQYLRHRHGEIKIPDRQGAPEGLRAHLVTATGNSNMSIKALHEAGVSDGLKLHIVAGQESQNSNCGVSAIADGASAVLRLHLADTSSGINYGDADEGLKLYSGAGTKAVDKEANAMVVPTIALGFRTYLADAADLDCDCISQSIHLIGGGRRHIACHGGIECQKS